MTMPLPEAIIAVWAPFAALFTQPMWRHMQVLWMGAVLCRGPRTVAAVLRVIGSRIKAKGRYRDAVRSTRGTVVKCYGLKWISLMVLVPLLWSTQPWALPFLTILAPSERANQKAQRHHKNTVEWTIQAVNGVSRWLGRRCWTLIGDGGHACVRLAHAGGARGVTLISRLRLDARLHAFPDRNALVAVAPSP